MDHLPITTNCSLGSFVHYMRLYLKVGKLSQEQETRLKEIGFDFNVQESLWNTRCKELAEYKENHGDFFVSYADNPVSLFYNTKCNSHPFLEHF